MELVRWDPFAEVRDLMERALADEFRPFFLWRSADGGAFVPIDMYQTPDHVVVKATIPGVKPEEVDISITADTLTIKGETKAEEEVKEADYIYRERRYGAFSRTVRLPRDLQVDKAEASFENGVLTVTIPKAEEVKPKQIKIKAKS